MTSARTLLIVTFLSISFFSLFSVWSTFHEGDIHAQLRASEEMVRLLQQERKLLHAEIASLHHQQQMSEDQLPLNASKADSLQRRAALPWEIIGKKGGDRFQTCRRAAEWQIFNPTLPTMVGPARRKITFALALMALDEGVPGDFLEAGVAGGGCSILLLLLLACYEEFAGEPKRLLWMADSWEGLPKKNATADLEDPDIVQGSYHVPWSRFVWQFTEWIGWWNAQALRIGDEMEGLSGDGEWYPVKIIERNDDMSFVVNASNSLGTSIWKHVYPTQLRTPLASGRRKSRDWIISSHNYRILHGLFKDTLRNNSEFLGRRLAFIRCDGDMYESIFQCLSYGYPLLSERGLVYIDDYWAFSAARKAVEEYLRDVQGLNPVSLLETVEEYDDSMTIYNASDCVPDAHRASSITEMQLDHTFRFQGLCKPSAANRERLLKIEPHRLANAVFWRKPARAT